jgi:hypothetical protein
MDTDELLRKYTLMFENWRFQVNSNWQRTNYFAAFETALLYGAWKVITMDYRGSGKVAVVFGAGLTVIWLLTDIKAGSYIDYRWPN